LTPEQPAQKLKMPYFIEFAAFCYFPSRAKFSADEKKLYNLYRLLHGVDGQLLTIARHPIK